MAVRNNFAAGEVLAAADLNDTFASKSDYELPLNDQSGTGASAYTFALADARRLTRATGSSAKTFTIPPQTSVVWLANTVLRVVNTGTGDLTIAGGSGVTVTNATKTLAQFESAALIRTASNAWTLVPFSGGVGNADFSNTATGTYTGYKYVTFTASGTLTVTKSGLCDVLLVGGGGGGGRNHAAGGGAGGHVYKEGVYLAAGSYTVTVGGGGAGGDTDVGQWPSGLNGNSSGIDSFIVGVGGGGGGGYRKPGSNGGSGGGGGGDLNSFAGGAAFTPQGNSGGAGSNGTPFRGGGGGGAGGAGATGAASGNGGAGTANSITGSSVTRAGGGGGGARSGSAAGAGGAGGGAAGSANDTTGGAGTANTGGGGGGGGFASGNGGAGGAGGSGVVIVRVAV